MPAYIDKSVVTWSSYTYTDGWKCSLCHKHYLDKRYTITPTGEHIHAIAASEDMKLSWSATND